MNTAWDRGIRGYARVVRDDLPPVPDHAHRPTNIRRLMKWSLLILAVGLVLVIFEVPLDNGLEGVFGAWRAVVWLLLSAVVAGAQALVLRLLWKSPERQRATGCAAVAVMVTIAALIFQFQQFAYNALVTPDLVLNSLAQDSEPYSGEVFRFGSAGAFIKGDIYEGLVEPLNRINDEGPGIRKIYISSGGGAVNTAYAIAAFIEENNVEVMVVDECLSACTIIAFSARSLSANRNAVFGFHPLSFYAGPYSQPIRWALDRDNEDYFDFLKDHAVPLEVISKARRLQPDDMHYETAVDMERWATVDRLVHFESTEKE